MDKKSKFRELIKEVELDKIFLVNEQLNNNDTKDEEEYEVSTKLSVEVSVADIEEYDSDKILPVKIRIGLIRYVDNEDEIFNLNCEFVSSFKITDYHIDIEEINKDRELTQEISKELLNKAYPDIRMHINNVLTSCKIILSLPDKL